MYIAAEYDDSQGERDIYSIDVSTYPVVSRGHEMRTCALIKILCTDDKGAELKNVIVKASLTSTGRLIAEKKTNSEGLISMAIPGNQDYSITAEFEGIILTKNIRPLLNELSEVTIHEKFIFQKD
jgi:hypothetical protein